MAITIIEKIGVGGSHNSEPLVRIAKRNRDSPFYIFTFMASHGLIVLNVFYLIIVYRMVLYPGALIRSVVITNVLLIGVLLINWVLDANYFYLFYPPDVSNPLILTDVQPYYFLNMELVAVAVLYILSVPMTLYRNWLEN